MFNIVRANRPNENARRSNGGAGPRSRSHLIVVLGIHVLMSDLSRDVKLLSFGDDEEAEEEIVTFKKKPIVRPDCESIPFLCVPYFIELIVCSNRQPRATIDHDRRLGASSVEEVYETRSDRGPQRVGGCSRVSVT